MIDAIRSNHLLAFSGTSRHRPAPENRRCIWRVEVEKTDQARSRSRLVIIFIMILVACGLCLICGAGGGVTVYWLTRPTPTAGDVSFPAREMGETNAKAVVEVFSDFQCPPCSGFAAAPQTRLEEEYIRNGKVRLIFRNILIVDSYVGNGHESRDAALAALCAGGQGKFWEYHDMLFQNQAGENSGGFSIPRLESFAEKLGLNMIEFSSCLNNSTYLDILEADIRRADALNLNAAPSFLVNGILVQGNSPDYQWLFDAIDRALLSSGG
jgi:protein-disulfide isomerase